MTTLHQSEKLYVKRSRGPSQLGWALLLVVLLAAAVLRFWQLGQLPPGLYRDEAFNGLDALDVLAGHHAPFFPNNHGREPAYIYLTALSIALVGRQALAVRLAAAVMGTLTTWIVYQLATSWFGRLVGLLSAWLWAVTLWPVHLSRIGLRPILLAPLLALAFWLGTRAYRQQSGWLWLLAGVAYGAAFYTYLAVRFTPLLLLLFLLYLLVSHPAKARQKLWPGMVWFGVGTVVILLPLLSFAWQHPDLFLGRTGQVSILNRAVNGGNLWGTLWRQTGQALAMFLWHGDTILRHNPAGRPVFDLFMALPFLAGVVWCGRHWRRPAATAVLLWTAVMLGPTILAADAPHFLRASGVLPAAIILPAIGLAQLSTWSRLPRLGRQLLVIILAIASLVVTIRDYTQYGRQSDVAYLFEAAATDLAQQINAETPQTAVFVAERFWSRWSSIRFLVQAPQINRFRSQEGLPGPIHPPAAIYAWPHEPLDYIPQALSPPALITAETGSLARNDLEETAYPLYVRYGSQPRPQQREVLANFDDQLQLREGVVSSIASNRLAVDLYWSTETAVQQDLVVFVHVTGPDGMVGQDDAPPADGNWHWSWWQPGYLLRDRHVMTLSQPYDAARHQVRVGLYDAQTHDRLPTLNADGTIVGDSWLLQP